ncbi:hypothetical protein D3C81_959240 [compost metagenome]
MDGQVDFQHRRRLLQQQFLRAYRRIRQRIGHRLAITGHVDGAVMDQPPLGVMHQHIAHRRLRGGVAHQRANRGQILVIERVDQAVGQALRQCGTALPDALIEHLADHVDAVPQHFLLGRCLTRQHQRDDGRHHQQRRTGSKQETGLQAKAKPVHSTSRRMRAKPLRRRSRTRWLPASTG